MREKTVNDAEKEEKFKLQPDLCPFCGKENTEYFVDQSLKSVTCFHKE